MVIETRQRSPCNSVRADFFDLPVVFRCTDFMRFTQARLVFQEVPDEISLAFLITGCPVRCPGCHSAASWKENSGTDLTIEALEALLVRHARVLTCVVFLGGEWHEPELLELLDHIRTRGFKTCLYTGLEEREVPMSIRARLDFLKVGPYRAERGGLQDPNTNQKFIDLRDGKTLNHRFQRQGGSHGQTHGSATRREDPLHQ